MGAAAVDGTHGDADVKRHKAAAQAKVRNGLIAALDIGTTKVCCLIARPAENGSPFRVVGIGHHASQGVRSGALVDLDGAEATIRTTVEAAERMAGDNIRGVVVNVSTGAPRSRMTAYEVSVAGHEIGDADLRRILDPVGVASDVPPSTTSSTSSRSAIRSTAAAACAIRAACSVSASASTCT